MFCQKHLSSCGLIVFFIQNCFAASFIQEKASVEYCDTKFVRDLVIFRSGGNRSAPYLTSVNMTTLQPWGNNVTAIVSYTNLNVESEQRTFEVGTCTGLKWQWVHDWYKKFSDLPIDRCPVPPGTYHYSNIELPPKNLPIAISPGKYKLKFITLLTRSKTIIFELSMIMRSLSNKKAKRIASLEQQINN